VPEISPVLEVVEDLLLFGVDGRREGLDGAVDLDGCRAQRAELADDVADGQAGAVLHFAAVTRFIEERTGWSIKRFVRTARRYRTVQTCVGQHILTAEDPLPP
jgi:hypothetical protein